MEQIRRRASILQDGPRSAPQARAAPLVSSAPLQQESPQVQVIYGASVQAMPLEGLSVAQAREIGVSVLQADPRAPALVNGREAPADYVLQANDTLEFVHLAGEKGHGLLD